MTGQTSRHSTALAAIATCLLICAIVRADTVTIEPSKDNTLYEDTSGSLSNGAGDHLFAGKTGGGLIRRALVAFDVAGSVPAGATINSATLQLNMSKTISGNQTVSLHRLLGDWGEGTSDAPGEEGGGSLATANDATWIHRFSGGALWTTAGGDFNAAASASTGVAGTGNYTWGSTAAMVGDVQSFLDAPAGNFGWILIGNEQLGASAKRFDSRQHPTAANRPTLTIDFTPIPEPSILIAVLAGAAALVLRRRKHQRGT